MHHFLHYKRHLFQLLVQCSSGVASWKIFGNQSPLPLIDLVGHAVYRIGGWESVTSPFDRLTHLQQLSLLRLGISHLSL